ncbi:hypothetical protein PCC6912_50930 [Chlorogloeopsis fritschii PCC 6912]|uniref:Uncharacterized protein n=1 Tax=Chlorogloeopsis fritschii PCC 6912 TaxID=211165 RepID=A0A3S0ZY08_CHLFR|nr:hypothetical protein [Chlorogloeopsis fritschii]RUR74915.1 hypothetical protein PCC6912_50930 [Chlorogloeopsis fritschii PCC 6912]
MSKQEQERSRLLEYFNFIAGNTDECGDIESVKRFIAKRSRVNELLRLKAFISTITAQYRKTELVNLFCSLEPKDRCRALESFPDLIVATIEDCRLFKVGKPTAVSTRYGDFASGLAEYPVFSILEVLKLIEGEEVA